MYNTNPQCYKWISGIQFFILFYTYNLGVYITGRDGMNNFLKGSWRIVRFWKLNQHSDIRHVTWAEHPPSFSKWLFTVLKLFVVRRRSEDLNCSSHLLYHNTLYWLVWMMIVIQYHKSVMMQFQFNSSLRLIRCNRFCLDVIELLKDLTSLLKWFNVLLQP